MNSSATREFIPPGCRQRLIEMPLQAETVEQAGQHVVMGDVVQALLGRPLGRNIGEMRHVIADAAISSRITEIDIHFG